MEALIEIVLGLSLWLIIFVWKGDISATNSATKSTLNGIKSIKNTLKDNKWKQQQVSKSI
jgi:hypothetical protein